MGRQNLDVIEATLERHRIDADFRRAPEEDVATQPWHQDVLGESAVVHRAFGDDVDLPDADAKRDSAGGPSSGKAGAVARAPRPFRDRVRFVRLIRNKTAIQLPHSLFSVRVARQSLRVGSR
jgi:hypothetical protein